MSKWIIYCDKVIDICAKNEDKDLEFIECNKYSQNQECLDIVYYGEAIDYVGQVKELRYHYYCVKDDPIVQRKHSKALIAPVPKVSGLEYISQDVKSRSSFIT